MKALTKSKMYWVLNALIVCGCMLISPAVAAVRLPHIIGDHMVIQQEKPVKIWGWADAGEMVSVTLSGQTAKTKAGKEGTWQVKLPAMKADGKVYQMTIAGENTITLNNILVGEVWLCSGQSNMEMGVAICDNSKEEIAAADYPDIRLYMVPKIPSGEPVSDRDATWKACTPETIAQDGWGGFTAAGYYFGRELHKQLNVPIGLIQSAWGGTRIEPWTPPVGFEQVKALESISKEIVLANLQYRNAVKEQLDEINKWVKATKKALANNSNLPESLTWPMHPLYNNGHPVRPTALYNGMIHPIAPFAIRGAIWYQGESNLGEGMMYLEKTRALLAGWREVWGQGDLPYYFVQLAPYNYGGDPYRLPEIWEAQTAALKIPNTGMAVTTDISNLKDIHPRNKQDVGKRLALWALARTYNKKNLVYSGPMYKAMTIEAATIRVRFDHLGSGLASRDDKPLDRFEIAGADNKFVDAQAVIDGDSVIVSSDQVKEPKSVRFGWHQLAEPNLMNKEGLPASPFRTSKP
ncbi:MAG: sialate O-acetylesterase [Phycisphaerae bacterium]|nr:sialate O-acetylesterase [Phycisphaerae bacterium]